MRVRMRERKRALYHSATADVRESAKKNDDGTTERVKSPAARATMTIEYHYHSRVNRVIRLPSTARTSA